jgi:hypothetical protein
MTTGPSEKPPMRSKAQQAWDVLCDKWRGGGRESLEVRRAALVGIMSFLGLDVDEEALVRRAIEEAEPDKIRHALVKIERLLQ